MDDGGSKANARFLESEMQWLYHCMKLRLRKSLGVAIDDEPVQSVDPTAPDTAAKMGQFILQHKLKRDERFILNLALSVELKPNFLFKFFASSPNHVLLGAAQGSMAGELLPTMQTAIFLLGGDDVRKVNRVKQILSADHPLIRLNVLSLKKPSTPSSHFASIIRITPEYLHLFTTGQELKPSFGPGFPARRLQTRLEWEDLVIPAETRRPIQDIELWLKHKRTFLEEWGMGRRYGSGYAALFHGPPGTGKTMAASLLGKTTGRDVYRIDLSAVVSKYIGETEKNLARIFDQAEDKEWILFFDEADSLFGKRGKVSDARDRYANQDVSFLLQRLEDFNGLSILASKNC